MYIENNIKVNFNCEENMCLIMVVNIKNIIINTEKSLKKHKINNDVFID